MAQPITINDSSGKPWWPSNQSSGGSSTSGMGSAFSAGSGIGGSIASYFHQSNQRQLQNKLDAVEFDRRKNLQGLLLGRGDQFQRSDIYQGLDVVGGADDSRSQYLPTGTVANEILPEVVDARKQIFSLLSQPAIGEPAIQRMDLSLATKLGQQLGGEPTSTNLNQTLSNLSSFGDAGTVSAQNRLQANQVNQEFGQQARGNSLAWLQGLYNTALGG